jgi:hypothetical protein
MEAPGLQGAAECLLDNIFRQPEVGSFPRAGKSEASFLSNLDGRAV